MKDCEFCTDDGYKKAPKDYKRWDMPIFETEKRSIAKNDIYLCKFHYKEIVINK